MVFNSFCIGKCTKPHINKIQIFQNKYKFKLIANALIYKKRKFKHKYFPIKETQDPIKTLSKHFHGSLLNSTGSLYYNFHAHPPQHTIKRGHPHDLLN